MVGRQYKLVMGRPTYHLKGALFQSPNEENSLLEINETFQDANIQNARKNAFSKFQSYIDVYLESMGLTYTSDEQAGKDMYNYMSAEVWDIFKLDLEMNVDADFDKGLYLYFVPDSSQYFTTQEGEKVYKTKYLLRYIDNGAEDLSNKVTKHLELEQLIVKSIMLKEKSKDEELDKILSQFASLKS